MAKCFGPWRRCGAQVTGIDPTANAIDAARALTAKQHAFKFRLERRQPQVKAFDLSQLRASDGIGCGAGLAGPFRQAKEVANSFQREAQIARGQVDALLEKQPTWALHEGRQMDVAWLVAGAVGLYLKKAESDRLLSETNGIPTETPPM